MRRVRKLVALLLSLAMVLAMSGVAMATSGPATLSGGEVGGYTSPDSPTVQDKSVIIQKELKSDNSDNSVVNAPTMSYTYAITAATGGKTVTDDTSDHANGVAVSVATKPGVVTNLNYTTTLEWTPAEQLNEGSNIKNIVIDFDDVVFTEVGVYRYVITETYSDYASAGVTATTGTHTRYLDVYVKRNDSFTDGLTAAQWDIYGYVCLAADTNVSSATAKTNGFVEVLESSAGAGDGVDPDIYYTYNLTITKTVAGDNYLMNSHSKFPFTVKFENSTVSKNVLPIVSANSYATIGTALTADDINNITAHDPQIGHEGTVTYTGIPSGTKVTVFETNNQAGTTYSVTTTGGDTIFANTLVANPNNSGDVIVNAQTALVTNVSKAIEFTNTLSLISPTGLMFRYGPYVLILICGVVLLFLGVKFMRRNKEED